MRGARNDRQLELPLGPLPTGAAPRRLSQKLAANTAAILPGRSPQLRLSDEWDVRECRGSDHLGPRSLPADQFARNGTLRRNTCNACRARTESIRARQKKHEKVGEFSLIAMLHRLWRPTSRTA